MIIQVIPVVTFQFGSPAGIVIDIGASTLYWVDSGNSDGQGTGVYAVTEVNTMPTSPDCNATQLLGPNGACVDPGSGVCGQGQVPDVDGVCVDGDQGLLTSFGTVTTIATASTWPIQDDRLRSLINVGLDKPSGNLYFTDAIAGELRRINVKNISELDDAEVLITSHNTTQGVSPFGMLVDSTNYWLVYADDTSDSIKQQTIKLPFRKPLVPCVLPCTLNMTHERLQRRRMCLPTLLRWCLEYRI